MNAFLSQIIVQRLDELARISEEPQRLTRTYGSAAMRRANELVASWMRAAGMAVRTDAIGNLIGHYPAAQPDGKILLLGSHLDSVRDAGRFDGPLGVLVAIACVQALHEAQVRAPFAVEVVAFADEEGVRFQSTYLGSRALAGTFNSEDLKRTDAKGITLADAIRDFGGNPEGLATARLNPDRLLGYVEVHIEQGPVLEQKKLPLGVVSAIAGQSRVRVTFSGLAGHAGTVPMNLRQDALCGAAEFVLAVEAFAQGRGALVATVGELHALPGASNVIPGQVRLSLDVRHADDALRVQAVTELKQRAQEIAAERRLQCEWELVHETAAVVCQRRLTLALEKAVRRRHADAPLLASGAGHDAAALAAVCPVAMLFVRCKGGISHHPTEFASEADIRAAVEVMNEFLETLMVEGGAK